jgi:hypothetical protein
VHTVTEATVSESGSATNGRRTLDGGAVITGHESFDAITGGDFAVAGLYLYAKLDRLTDLACLVAADFFARPHLYISFEDPDTPARLARLNSRIGSEEYYPSAAHRRAMYEPVFGPGDPAVADGGDFARLRDGLLSAAAAYAEWSQATGIPMLEERVRTEHRPFREYLDGVTGATVRWSRDEALPVLADNEAYRVLREPGVIGVFGLQQRADADWPWCLDTNGDKAVEQIGRALETPERRLTRESFSAVQRVALRGAEALTAILTFDESQDPEALTALITRCYTWHAALKAWLAPGVVTGSPNGTR